MSVQEAREGVKGFEPLCWRPVVLVKGRCEVNGDGVIEAETRERVEVGCRGRTCPGCAPSWRRYHAARLVSGTVGVPVDQLRFWTVTGPGQVSDVEAWNRSLLERYAEAWRALRRRHPFVEAYYGAKEFQQRGVLHLHMLVRQRTGDLLPRGDLGSDGWVSRMLVNYGFGPQFAWYRVEPRKGGVNGAVAYVGKYLLKSAHDSRFVRGAHVDFWSRNWSLVWRQHEGVGEVVVAHPSGVQVVESWRFSHVAQAFTRSAEELVARGESAVKGARPT